MHCRERCLESGLRHRAGMLGDLRGEENGSSSPSYKTNRETERKHVLISETSGNAGQKLNCIPIRIASEAWSCHKSFIRTLCRRCKTYQAAELTYRKDASRAS
jgi:hypothetical protein